MPGQLQRCTFQTHFGMGTKDFQKLVIELNCSSPCNLSFSIQLLQECENMFSLVLLSKSKFFTRAALVSYMQHLCRTCVVNVVLMSHSCCTRVARASLVLHSCHSCCTRVAFVLLVSHSCCKIDQIYLYHFCYKCTY